VKVVKDISPYRLRKVRILNGAHTAMVPFAYLLGCRTVRESINDERIGQWIRELIFQEIVPSMDLEESELKTYAKAILERFENPFLDHQLESIALNSISKFRIRVLTSILEYHNKFQKWPEQLLFAFAALILIYKGKNQGKALPLKDNPEILEFFLRSWNLENRSVSIKGILQNQNLWGQDLYILPGLAKTLLKALKKLESELNSSEG
jgi:tagaturonate reductase